MGQARKYKITIDSVRTSGVTTVEISETYDLTDAFSGTSVFDSGSTFSYDSITLGELAALSDSAFETRATDFISYVSQFMYEYTLDELNELIEEAQWDYFLCVAPTTTTTTSTTAAPTTTTSTTAAPTTTTSTTAAPTTTTSTTASPTTTTSTTAAPKTATLTITAARDSGVSPTECYLKYDLDSVLDVDIRLDEIEYDGYDGSNCTGTLTETDVNDQTPHTSYNAGSSGIQYEEFDYKGTDPEHWETSVSLDIRQLLVIDQTGGGYTSYSVTSSGQVVTFSNGDELTVIIGCSPFEPYSP